jgi:3-oxoacyl-[acyl-carrier protein] reductase
MTPNPKKAAIVTGASQGIGYAIANYLAAAGYHLLLISRSHEKLKKAAEEIKIKNKNAILPEIAAIDVSDYHAVKTCVEQFAEKVGSIDLLCNNAGYVKRGTSELPHDEFLKMINTNLIGAFNFIQVVSPLMKEKRSGRIINIASRSGKIARKFLGGYAASKFGLVGLSEAICKELVSYGIYVTAICPAFVATDMTSDVDMDRNEMIQPDDIVKTLDYLLNLSPAVVIKEIVIDCKVTLIE